MMDTIRLVTPADRVTGPPTPGIQREQAAETDGMWTGVAHTEPGMVSAWHHHGDYETSIYIAKGMLRMEFGPGGKDVLDARPGDFLIVPKRAVHREGNPTADVSELIVTRAGAGKESTFNVDGPA
jgi:uncharacterized RmlC-like cupin family protein